MASSHKALSQRQATKAFKKVVAAEEGLSLSRLKQLVDEPKQVADTWAAPLAGLAGAVPKKPPRKG